MRLKVFEVKNNIEVFERKKKMIDFPSASVLLESIDI